MAVYDSKDQSEKKEGDVGSSQEFEDKLWGEKAKVSVYTHQWGGKAIGRENAKNSLK